MSTHTPGPWNTFKVGSRWYVDWINGAKRHEVAEVASADDARLIAAAPEMVALIRELVEKDGDVPDIEDVETARALLAKIEGSK